MSDQSGFGGAPPSSGGFGPPGGGGFGPPGGGFGPPGGGFGPPPGGPPGSAPYGGPGGYGQPPAGGFTPPPIGPKTDTLSIVALVCGILGFLLAIPSCCCGPFICIAAIPGLAGLICGIISLRRIKREPDRYAGAGLAVGGIAVSAITVLGTLVMTVLLAVSIATSPNGSYRYDDWNSYGGGGGSGFDWD
jgi:hypothetical protein